MFTCRDCGPTVAPSCRDPMVETVGGVFPRSRHMDYSPCGHCGVQRGGIHHVGCPAEICPFHLVSPLISCEG